jgi:4-amino-4-deoxy-L-arabinose transferase-like glycosyltransferase
LFDGVALERLRASQNAWVRRLANADYLAAGAVAVFGALLFIPFLGAVGLWDPWEVHYGEVGRSMIQRNDYLYPYWENAYFFSKSPLTMWIQALGMQLVGTNRTEGALAIYTEWGMRLPFALWSIGSLALLAYALSRVVSRRVALATAFALATMPLFFLITRQCVTDTPLVTAMTCALGCAVIGQFDQHTNHRSAWWYGCYVMCGLAALAKESLGLVVPAILAVFAILCLVPTDSKSWRDHLQWLWDRSFRAEVNAGKRPMPTLWAQFYRMRLGTGVLVFLATAIPWYATLIAFRGLDDEGHTFLERVIQDNFSRLMVGVHTTTPGGSFTYFIEQGGFGIFPWVALVPGALAFAGRLRLRSGRTADQVGVLAAIWVALTFLLVSASATKFHHYILPALPGLAILIGLFVDQLWEDGVASHAISLMFGLVLFILVGKDLSNNPKNFTDLFVYNYDRPYPTELVQRPMTWFGSRAVLLGDLLALVLIGGGAYLLLEAFSSKRSTLFTRAVALLISLEGIAFLLGSSVRRDYRPTLLLAVPLFLVAILLGFELFQAVREKRPASQLASATGGLVATGVILGAVPFVLGSDPLLPTLSQAINVKLAMGFAFAIAGTLCALAALMRARAMLFSSFWALAFGFALWFNWSHWVSLSHHWTQRDQFWRYYAQGKPDEPIAAFMMNWRGETFYSRNTVKQIKENSKMAQYAALPGRKWALVEHNRLQILRNAIGAERQVNLVDRDLNNKFVLVNFE